MSYPRTRVYAVASRFHHRLSGMLDHPLELVIGRRAAPTRWPMMMAANVRRCYFRTQITRTTDALASDDPSDPLTPLALRNLCTVSGGTSAACAAGAAFGGPATITGFNKAMPANLPSLSSAAAPEKPTAGAGDSAKSLPLPTRVTEALMLLTVARPPWFCGSAMPVSSTPDFAAPLLKVSGFSPRAP